MNRLLLLVLLGFVPAAFAQTPTVFDDPGLTQHYQNTITGPELAGHLYFYASDFFEGRETATRGQHLAALYLAGQYRTMGLTPKGTEPMTGPYDPRAFLQPFELEREVVHHAILTVNSGTGPERIAEYGTSRPLGSDFLISGDEYLVIGDEGEVITSVLFGGYGLETEAFDDYAAMDAAGLSPADKWLMILEGEPTAEDGSSLITEDGAPSVYSQNAFRKLRTAFQRGPSSGVLLVSSDGPETLSTRAQERLHAIGGLSLPGGAETQSARKAPPIYVISEDLANSILAMSGRTVAELREQMNATLLPEVFLIDDSLVQSSIEKGSVLVGTENVAAFIEGSDPILKNEVVIVSAHLDHIGMDPSAEGDQINNGADDDGSGTVSLLEIAEAFQSAKEDGHGPRRSLLFLHVAGEEKGLLGSEYYADHEPLIPLDNTVADLNIDMIGRQDPSYEGSDTYVDIIGAELISTDIDEVNTRVNEVTGLGLELSKRFNSPNDPNQFFRRSDHWNFGKHQIPFIFYFNGTHEDYHGVDDEPDKINYDLMALRARLVFGTAWQLANQEARPAVSGQGFN